MAPAKIARNSMLFAILDKDGYHLTIPDHPVAHRAMGKFAIVWQDTHWVAPIVAGSDRDIVASETRKALNAVDAAMAVKFGEDYLKPLAQACRDLLRNRLKEKAGQLAEMESRVAELRREAAELRREAAGLRRVIEDTLPVIPAPAPPRQPYNGPLKLRLSFTHRMLPGAALPEIGALMVHNGHPIQVRSIGKPKSRGKAGADVEIDFDWAHEYLAEIRERIDAGEKLPFLPRKEHRNEPTPQNSTESQAPDCDLP